MLDEGRSAGELATSQSWEGMYYFADINGDGRKEMLINRRVHETKDGTITHKNQKLIYEFEPKTLSPVDATEKYSDRLPEIFRRVKSDPNLLHIPQVGLPMETTDDLGEAIYPQEEEWRPVKYADVQPPEIGPEPAMKPIIFAESERQPIQPSLPTKAQAPPVTTPKSTLAPIPAPAVERSAQVWPWICGIAALAVIALLVWKRRD